MSNLNLPSAGFGRFWSITHQPTKKATPLRIELRQSNISSAKGPILSLSKVIGFEDTIADAEKIEEAAKIVLARAGQVDEFVGIYTE